MSGESTNEERRLIGRMLRGDERAFSDFFDRYFARVYRFCLSRLNGDVDAAQEVVQAALCKAMRKIDSYRGEAAMFTWLCQICRREVVDYLRRHRRHSENVVLIDDQPELRAALDAIAAPEDSQPGQRYGRTELCVLIQAVLDRLPVDYADALEWKYIEELSVEEIAGRLGLGRTAAQSLLARARQSFRTAVGTVFGAEAGDLLAGFGSE